MRRGGQLSSLRSEHGPSFPPPSEITKQLNSVQTCRNATPIIKWGCLIYACEHNDPQRKAEINPRNGHDF